MQNFEILDFLLPVFPTKMPQRITSEDLTFERQVFFYILSGNLTTGQQELPRSQRDSQSISERHWDAVLSVEGLFFWLKLCVTSRVRQHSGLANRYHARDSWSMQMQELKQLYSPATKDTEKRKIWHYDFLRFHQKKVEQMSRKSAMFFLWNLVGLPRFMTTCRVRYLGDFSNTEAETTWETSKKQRLKTILMALKLLSVPIFVQVSLFRWRSFQDILFGIFSGLSFFRSFFPVHFFRFSVCFLSGYFCKCYSFQIFFRFHLSIFFTVFAFFRCPFLLIFFHFFQVSFFMVAFQVTFFAWSGLIFSGCLENL